jgi:hypothetical protein
MARRVRRFLLNILAVILAIVVTLGLLEVGFRIFTPQRHFAVTVNTWDPEVGTKHVPGARGFVINPQYETNLVINSKGLRDREFPYEKPASTRRILCLGGSFTCGYGVDAEQTFAKVLEQRLNSDDDQSENWEVLNGGVGSTGTAHQLAFFKSEGYRYSPDILLLCFSQATDFWDNIISGLYSLEDGRLVKHDAPRTPSRRIQKLARWIPAYTSLFAKSHLLNFVKARMSQHHYRDLAERIQMPEDVSAVEAAEEELTRHLLIAMRDACAEIDCRLVVTAIPLPNTWGWYDETVELIDFMEAQGIPFVDLSSVFRAAADKGIQIAYPKDLHWTQDGHRHAAGCLHDFFTREAEGER